MRLTLTLCAALLIGTLSAQITVHQTGACFRTDQTLAFDTTIDGKAAYKNTDAHYVGLTTSIEIYWSADDRSWYLAFGGTPFYSNDQVSAMPPATGWEVLDATFYPYGQCADTEAPTLSGDVQSVTPAGALTLSRQRTDADNAIQQVLNSASNSAVRTTKAVVPVATRNRRD